MNEPQPDHILQTGLGFWAAKTLLSAVEMELFTELAKHPEDLETLQGRLGLHPRSARDFFDALVSLKFLERRDGRYYNTPSTDIFLDKRKPSYIGGVLEMGATLRPRGDRAPPADLAASYEHAIVEALMVRVERALDADADPRLAIGGGVAANRLLRERAAALGVPVHVPPPELCTDNAAMIGSAARWVEPRPVPGLPRPRRLRHCGGLA